MTAESLDLFKRAFTNLRPFRFPTQGAATSVGAGVLHKGILLLSVIDQAEAGALATNRVQPGDSLLAAFMTRWTSLTNFKARKLDFALAFFHLRSDTFWHLEPVDGMASVLTSWRQPTTLAQLRDFVACARLDMDLFELMRRRDSRESLRECLLRTLSKLETQTARAGAARVAHRSMRLPNEAKNSKSRAAVKIGTKLPVPIRDLPLAPKHGTEVSILGETCRDLLDQLDADWRVRPININGSGGNVHGYNQKSEPMGIVTLGDLEQLTPLALLALVNDDTLGTIEDGTFWRVVVAAVRSMITPIIANSLKIRQKDQWAFVEDSRLANVSWPQDTRLSAAGALFVPDGAVLANPYAYPQPLLCSWMIAALQVTAPEDLATPFEDLVVPSKRRSDGERGTEASAASSALRVTDVVAATPATLLAQPGVNENTYRTITRLIRGHLGTVLWRALKIAIVDVAHRRRDDSSPKPANPDVRTASDPLARSRGDGRSSVPMVREYDQETNKSVILRGVIRGVVDHALNSLEVDAEDATLFDSLNAVSIELLSRELLSRALAEQADSLTKQLTHARRGLVVMMARFGVPNGKQVSIQDAATYVGVGPQRARQLEELAAQRLRDAGIVPYTNAIIHLVSAAIRKVGGAATLASIDHEVSSWLPFGEMESRSTIRWISALNPDILSEDGDVVVVKPYTPYQARHVYELAVVLARESLDGIRESELIKQIRSIAVDSLLGVPDTFIRSALACTDELRRNGDTWSASASVDASDHIAPLDPAIVSWLETVLDRASQPLHWDELNNLARARGIDTPLLGEAVMASERVRALTNGYYILADQLADVDSSQSSTAQLLTSEQRLVADALPTARLLVTAGPGTGKTHTLIARLTSLITRDGLNPGQDLLVLSFSRAAVREIRQRIAVSDSDIRFVTAYTFDSFATHLLMETDPGGAWEDEDFDGRIRAAVERIRLDPEARAIVSEFSHVVVDEIQDLVAEREDLVKAILEVEIGGFTLLGDPAQGIYNWHQDGEARRIGSAALYGWLRSRFGDVLQELTLTRNHRAVSKITRIALPLGSQLARTQVDFGLTLSDLRAALATIPTFENVEAVAKILRGTRVRTAILCRTNGQGLLLSRQLFKLGVDHFLQPRGTDRLVAPWLAVAFEGIQWTRIGKTAFIREFEQRFEAQDREDVPDALTAWRVLKMMDPQPGDMVDLGHVLARIRTGYVPDDALVIPSATVTVSTIHRAKGLEFDRVIVVEDGLGENIDDEITRAEESRVLFVALTRAKREMYGLKHIGQKGVHYVEAADRWIRGFGWRVLDIEMRGEEIHAADPAGGFMLKSVDVPATQRYIFEKVRGGDSITLTRVAMSTEGVPRVFYAVLHNGVKVGITSEKFMAGFYQVLKYSRSWRVRWPERIEDLRVEGVDTIGQLSLTSRRYGLGESGLWLRVRVSGLGHLHF